jgi:hypothetical protein
MELGFSRQIFKEYSGFHENPANGCRVSSCGRTDGRTDMYDEANNRFSQFWEQAEKKLQTPSLSLCKTFLQQFS